MSHYRFIWQGNIVNLIVCDPSIAQCAAHLMNLPLMKVEPLLSKEQVDIKVSHQESGSYCIKAEGREYFLETLDDALIYVVTFIGAIFLRQTCSLVMHAGAFIVDGEAVLFTGEAYAGKSQIALAAWRAGFAVLGDDWLLVEPTTSSVQAFPKPMKPRLAANEAPDWVTSMVPTQDRLVGRFNAEWRLLLSRSLADMADYDRAYPIKRLALLKRDGAMITQVHQVDAHTALGWVIDQTVITKAPSSLGLIRPLTQVLQAGEVYQVMVGQNDVPNALALLADDVALKQACGAADINPKVP